jgi:REP element-mobilizing transposase RayT
MCQAIYKFELVAAEPVANHIHIVIRTIEDDETISAIMQYIKSRIAEKYNRDTGRTGAFWNGRFGNKVVEEAEDPEQYLLWLLWYIGYNPVRKGLSKNPRNNYIGFINVYLNENHKAVLHFTRHKYFLNLGDTFEECVQRFLEYEQAYLKSQEVKG